MSWLFAYMLVGVQIIFSFEDFFLIQIPSNIRISLAKFEFFSIDLVVELPWMKIMLITHSKYFVDAIRERFFW